MTHESRALWLAVFALAGCGYPRAGAAPGTIAPGAVQAAQSRWPDASAATLEQGRQLFLGRCNACHDYPDRAAIAAERWPAIVEGMGAKAHLEAADRALVLRFILATRVEAPTHGGSAAP